MNRSLRALLSIWVVGLIVLASACRSGGEDQQTIAPDMPQQRRDLIVNERLSALQERFGELDRRLNEVRAAQDSQLAETLAMSRKLNEDLMRLRSELASTPDRAEVTPVPAPPATAMPSTIDSPPEQESSALLLGKLIARIILLVLLAGAIVLLVKLLMGGLIEQEVEDAPLRVAANEPEPAPVVESAPPPAPDPTDDMDFTPASDEEPDEENPHPGPPPT